MATPSQKKLAGIDIGHGNTKYCHFVGDHQVSSHFRSLTARLLPQDIRPDPSKAMICPVGEATYIVGDAAEAFLDHTATQRVGEWFMKSPGYSSLSKAALSRIGAPVIDMLGVGLPVNRYRQSKDELKLMTEGRHVVPSFTFDQKVHTSVEVKSAFVVPQPAGAMHYLVQAFQIPENASTLVIDVGHGTLDLLVAIGNNINLRQSSASHAGVEFAITNFLQIVAPQLNKSHLNLRQVQAHLFTDVELRLQTGEMTPIQARRALDELLDDQLLQGLKPLGDIRDFDYVAVIGGGARLYHPIVAKYVHEDAILTLKDTVEANAIGFALLARERM